MDEYSVFNNDEETPFEGVVLKKTRAKSKGGTLTTTVQPGEAVLPNAISRYRKRATDLYGQGDAIYNSDPDLTQMQEFAKQRGEQGEIAMLNALAAQYAGDGFAPVQEQLLKKAAAARDPMKLGGVMLTSDGKFIKDPFADRDKRAEFLLQQAKAYETLAQTAQSAQERLAAQQAQNEISNQLRLMGLGIQQMNANTARASSGPGGKAPAGYQWTTGQDGSPALTFIPGGPGDPKVKADSGTVTEDMRKSAGYAFRMDNALRLIKQLTGTDPSAQMPGLVPTLAGKIPGVGDTAQTLLTDANRQRVENAQIDALDAALTLATGAAYTREQLKGLSKSYFPQYGETDPKVIADKNQRLQEIIQTAKIRAGKAFPEGGQPGAPEADNNDPFGIRKRK